MGTDDIDDDDDDDGASEPPVDDEVTRQAVATIGSWFDKRRERVFYSRQLEVLNEERFFHWVTNRAIKQLVAEGFIRQDKGAKGTPKVLYHNSYRYPRREIAKLRELVAAHSTDEIVQQLGEHGEWLVERAFLRAGFRFIGQAVSELDGRRWTETKENLDYVFERDGRRYGVEVKNTLGYSNLGKELRSKTKLALHLGCLPLFACRFLPKSWNHEVITSKGFVLLFKWQLQHPVHAALAGQLRKELLLPVKVARAFPDGDMARFLRWHESKVAKEHAGGEEGP